METNTLLHVNVRFRYKLQLNIETNEQIIYVQTFYNRLAKHIW